MMEGLPGYRHCLAFALCSNAQRPFFDGTRNMAIRPSFSNAAIWCISNKCCRPLVERERFEPTCLDWANNSLNRYANNRSISCRHTSNSARCSNFRYGMSHPMWSNERKERKTRQLARHKLVHDKTEIFSLSTLSAHTMRLKFWDNLCTGSKQSSGTDCLWMWCVWLVVRPLHSFCAPNLSVKLIENVGAAHISNIGSL